MKKDSIPLAIIAAFLAVSQIALALPMEALLQQREIPASETSMLDDTADDAEAGRHKTS